MSYIKRPKSEGAKTLSNKNAKQKNAKDTSKFVPNADVFHTLNFMYQRACCAEMINLVHGDFSAPEDTSTSMRHFFALAKRAVIRIDPSIKHSVCRKCYRPMIEGLTSCTLIQQKRKCALIVKQCMSCKDERVVYSYALPTPKCCDPVKPHGKRQNLSQRQRRRRWMYKNRTTEVEETKILNPVPFSERMDSTAWQESFFAQGLAQGLDMALLQESASLRGGHELSVGLGRGNVRNPKDAM